MYIHIYIYICLDTLFLHESTGVGLMETLELRNVRKGGGGNVSPGAQSRESFFAMPFHVIL